MTIRDGNPAGTAARAWSRGGPWVRPCLDLLLIGLLVVMLQGIATTDIAVHGVFAVLVVRAFAVDLWGTMVWLAVITIALGWLVVDGAITDDAGPAELAEWLLLMGLVPLIAILAERRERAARRFAALYDDAAERLVAGQEDERRLVAQDLHDGVGQGLGALMLTLDTLDARIAEGGEVAPLIRQARGLAETVFDEVAGVALRLHPAQVHRDGVEHAVRDLVAHAGLPTELSVDPDAHPERLSADAQAALFRVVQEALSNVVRHSGAKGAWVAIHGSPDAVRVTVVDDGAGIADAGARRHGIGILGMRERAARVGGSLEITSRRGAGTLVVLTLPCHAATRAATPSPATGGAPATRSGAPRGQSPGTSVRRA